MPSRRAARLRLALAAAAALALLGLLRLRAAAAAPRPPPISSVCATLWARRDGAAGKAVGERVGAVAKRQRAARNDTAVAHAHLRAVREGVAESAERYAALLGPEDAYVHGLREEHQVLRYRGACVDAADMSAFHCGAAFGAAAAAAASGAASSPRPCFSQWFVLRPPERRCPRGGAPRRGLTWLVDVSHGYTRRWEQIFHFANAMFAAFDAAEGAARRGEPVRVATVALYQVASAAALRRAGEWFEQTAALLASRLGAPGRAAALLYGDAFAAGPLCFEEVFLVQKRLASPHFHAAAAARAYRHHALASHRLWAAVAAAPAQASLLLRTDERRWLNGAALRAQLPPLLAAELEAARAAPRAGRPPLPAALPLAAHELSGSLSFRWQLQLFASTALLLTPHGAQLTNAVFMPQGAAVIEVLNCGHFTDVPKRLALECGLRFVQTIDPAPGCDVPLGKRHIDDDRNVSLAELRPALRAVLASWALRPDYLQ